MKPKNILTREFLTEHFVNQRKSDKAIANEFGISSTNSVFQARKRHGVYRCSLKDSSYIITKEFLEEYYIKQNMTLKQVAQQAGFQRKSIVVKALQKFGIPQREHTRSIAVIQRKKRKHHTIPGRYFLSLKHGAKRRDILFDITLDELWDTFIKQNAQCALSGLPIRFHNPGEKCTAQTASVDRIDSNFGYTIDNIRWVHKTINLMKMDLQNQQFIYLCKKVAEYS
jgi:hypothetical protein